MMESDGLYRYLRAEGFQAAELHCDNYRLQFFLPDRDSNLHALRRRMTLANWREWISSMKTQHINLKIPRFRITGSENAKQHLEKMGVQEVFSSFQALRPMVTVAEGAYLTQGIEKTLLEIDEQGIRAGSVFGVGGVLGGILSAPPPPEFVVDRPFLFVISHRDGTVLYLGMVVDPIPMKPRSEPR
jgi:serpin B